MGDCLGSLVPPGSFFVTDTRAELRRGDLCIFQTRDQRAAIPMCTTSIGKRFVGVNEVEGFMEVENLKPPRVIHVGLSNLLCAHKVAAVVPTRTGARRAVRQLRKEAREVGQV